MLKKITYNIGIWCLLSFDFLCIEYFLYELLNEKTIFLYPTFVIFLGIIIFTINTLNKVNTNKKYVNDIITLVAVFTGLWMLKVIL